jgi:hypothetical protein
MHTAHAYYAQHAMPREEPSDGSDVMLYWLATVAKEARQAGGKKRAHYAAAADVDQATITRFENAAAWPRDPDELLLAYSRVLRLPPLELWRRAVQRWEESAVANGDGRAIA